MSALNRKLLRDLWGMKGQVLAIAAVIMGGIATLVMSLSTYDSLTLTRDAFYRDYRFAQVFSTLKRAPEALVVRIAALDGVERVETRVVSGAKLKVAGFDDPITGQLVSLPEGRQPGLNALHLKEGRLPLAGEEAVVSDSFALAHDLKLGQKLTAVANGKRFELTVVGVAVSPEYVYQIAPGAIFPDFKRYAVIWMGHRALAAASGLTGAFNDVSLTVVPGAKPAEVAERLDKLLAPYGGRGVVLQEQQLSNRFLKEELAQLRTTAIIFPGIFLGVAAFLLNVVLVRIIALQREQIAILKAFGYTERAIAWHFQKLVMLIILPGVVAGVALGARFGVGLAEVYRETTFRFPALEYRLSPEVVLLSLGVTLLSGVAATLLAVGRAARLSPAAGMRPEMPVAYRAAFLERTGLVRGLAMPTRMILRHIGRRPVKSLLTVLGIGTACALMMVGNYQKGAIDFMVDLQFRHAAREDLAVSFTDPTGSRALHELAALPGVRRVEGFRDVPAVLRFENHSYRGAVFGIEADALLHHPLDTALRPVVPPEAGVVLTDYLAREVLHVQPGDLLTVEVLEGSRPVRQVPVAGITRQYLGVSAYMRRDALNAMMREGEVVSGAYLAVAPERQGALQSRLNERPRVMGLQANASAIQSFYATIGEFILFYNLISAILAASIGFGVVYNSVRIALSERGRELASLRVLGFTRGEVAYILLGELGLLALIAIPVGMLLGTGLCAVMVLAFNNELYRLPLVIQPSNYALGASIVVVSTLLSGWFAWLRLGRLDLVAVLKTRE